MTDAGPETLQLILDDQVLSEVDFASCVSRSRVASAPSSSIFIGASTVSQVKISPEFSCLKRSAGKNCPSVGLRTVDVHRSLLDGI